MEPGQTFGKALRPAMVLRGTRSFQSRCFRIDIDQSGDRPNGIEMEAALFSPIPGRHKAEGPSYFEANA